MGHLRNKYTADYFLGGTDPITGRTYGVLGHEQYKLNEIGPRHREEFQFTLELADELKGKDVLDIGVGRGDDIPLFLAADVRSFHGIDFSPSSVALVRQRCSDPRVSVALQEAKDLREDRLFDVIVLYDAIEHIPVFEMEVVWRKIQRVLRPGGVVVLSTPVFRSPNVPDHSDEIPAVMGVHCHKQNLGTLLRTSLREGFLMAKNAERFFGLVRRADLALFPPERQCLFVENQRSLLEQFDIAGKELELTVGEREALVPAPGRLLIGCVSENTPKYLAQAVRLVQSIRWFGGDVAGANVLVCVVDEAETAWADELRRWGAFVRIVPRFSHFHPHSNKLRLLELAEVESYDTIMLLDCDTIMVQDPSPFLSRGVFQAKMADLATVPHETFRRLFEHFGRVPPEPGYRCTFSGEPTIWYCNAGVLIFPKECLRRLYPSWSRYTSELARNLDLLGAASTYCEQASLTLAFTEQCPPFCELPTAMNFPLHQVESAAPREMTEHDPVIIHYHHLTDPSGFLAASPYPLAQRRIDVFNQKVRDYRSKSFDNRLFWDLRYAEDPELGSGLGSRELPLLYKRQILRQTRARFDPGSILDIGCGDQSVCPDIPDDTYLGIDISPIAVEWNRTHRPQRSCRVGDFLGIDLPVSDLTVCFDVLVHQSTPEIYRRSVERILSLTRVCAVVSGFESAPAEPSDITFYHEPLSVTLRQAGAKNLRKIGAFGDMTVWLVTKEDGPFQAGGLDHSAAAQPAAAQSLFWESQTRQWIPRTGDVRQHERQSVSASVGQEAPGALPCRLESPVFIVGCMRSGTTLLAQILGRHRDVVHCPFELKYIWSKIGGVSMASPRTGDRICPEYGAMDAHSRIAERLTQAFLEEYQKNLPGKNKDALFLSKNPHLCNKLAFVNALFSDSRFIWIYRDLPSVVASLQRLFRDAVESHEIWHYWPEKQANEVRCWHCFSGQEAPADVDPSRLFPGGEARFLAEYWLETNRAVSEFFGTTGLARSLVIKEEELIKDMEPTMARCLGFLEVSLDLGILDRREMDGKRNEIWMNQLCAADRSQLLEFLQQRGGELDDIFPLGGLSSRYQRELSGAEVSPVGR